MSNMRTVSINWESYADVWWSEVHKPGTFIPDYLRPLINGCTGDTVSVTRKQAKETDEWMRNLPEGWTQPLVIR